MICNKKCCHFPCMKEQCGKSGECKDYKGIITDMIEKIDKERITNEL